MLICSNKRIRNSYLGHIIDIPEAGQLYGKKQIEQSSYCQKAVWGLGIDELRMYDTVYMLRT